MTFLVKSFFLVLKCKFCHIEILEENELAVLIILFFKTHFQRSDDSNQKLGESLID